MPRQQLRSASDGFRFSFQRYERASSTMVLFEVLSSYDGTFSKAVSIKPEITLADVLNTGE